MNESEAYKRAKEILQAQSKINKIQQHQREALESNLLCSIRIFQYKAGKNHGIDLDVWLTITNG